MEEEEIQEPPVMEEGEQDGGPGPGPVLKDADKATLAKIIRNMQAAKEPEDRIRSVVKTFTEKYTQPSLPAQPNYAQAPQQKPAAESTASPLAQTKGDLGVNQAQDPAILARQQHYNAMKQQAFQEVESPDWKDKIFTGKVPALTHDPGMPVEAFQKVDPKALEQYLDTKGLDNPDRYWMRNQLLNYGHQRHAQYYVQQQANERIATIPEVKAAQDAANHAVMTGQIKPEDYDATWKAQVAQHPEVSQEVTNAYAKAGQQYEAQTQEAIANRLNNIGIDDKPLGGRTAFRDQITGTNKALMGAVNFAGDLGQQLSSLLELGNVPGLSDLGYKLKTNADNLKADYQLPQNGGLGNTLAGEILPQALDGVVLAKLMGAAGRPIYQSLAKARATGQLGQFAEGALGGLAISPANSYVMAHQYYNQLVQQGEDPATAGAKSDQFLVKNIATDMLMTPVQMGLMKMGGGSWMNKALTYGTEAGVTGAHFTLQDFNQKATENPALTLTDYLNSDPDVKKTFVQGAAIGMLQKAAIDRMHKWDVNSENKDAFHYGRLYDTDDRNTLYSNKTIAGNVLSLMEMKDTPGRAGELHDLTHALQQSGVYNEHEADRLHGIINDVEAVRKEVPTYGKPETRLAVMNELLNKRAAESFVEGGGDVAAAHLKERLKASDERILRIMDGKEPLYFINGSETNRDQLMKAVEDNPELLSSKGSKIKVINDSETTKNLKDALQEQKRSKNVVRNPSGDGEAVGGRNEEEGAVDQGAPREEGAGPQTPTRVLEARHQSTEHDEQGIVSGHNQLGLSDEGVIGAHELKEEVQQNHAITKVVTSDLKRSKETGEIVADGKVPVESRAGLNSWDLKEFGGMKDVDFKPIQEWFAAHPDDKVYNGDIDQYKGKALGESLNEYANRAIEARQQVEDEGPGSFLVSHSNNMNIWEAYKDNGNKWDSEAIKDYISRPTPEPGEIVDAPEERDKGQQVVEAIKVGKVSDKEIERGAKLFIEHDKEPGKSVSAVHETDGAETGNNETDGAPGRPAKNAGAQGPVPAPEGTEAPQRNQGAQPVPASGGAADPVRLTKASKQLITAGRTDDQIMTYLARKGLDPTQALAVLGEAKANPINEGVKAASLEEAKKKFFGLTDDALGEKELAKVNSQQSAREFQQGIKDSIKADPKQKGVSHQDIDKAIQIYLDTQRNPTHMKEYYDKLSPEQKRIADLSQNLNTRQKEIADSIKESYEALGQYAMDNGIIKDVLENYVARAWDMGKGKPATEENFKFKTNTRHQLQRTLDTILQGYAEGMTLKIEGATNNLQAVTREIANVVENKHLLEQGLSLKVDTGERDAAGKPVASTMFTTKTDQPGYKRIESRAFRKWEYSGKLEDYSAEEKQRFGNDTMVAEDGGVMKKKEVYAPEEVAKALNNIMGSGKLTSFQKSLKFSAAVKSSILSLSPFHFIAFTRAHELTGKMNSLKDTSPINAYKTGLAMLSQLHPVGQALIRNGMTLNRQQKFMEGIESHNNWVGRQLDKLQATKYVKDKMVALNTVMHRNLFQSYGAGLKMFDGINLAKAELAKNPKEDPKVVYTRVAKLMNDTYGGINWDRMHGTRMQDPTYRQVVSLLTLAPDWTASNLRFAKKAIEGGKEGLLYRKAWAKVLLRGTVATTIANTIMAAMDDTDDDGNPLTLGESMARRYSKAWEAGHLRSTMVDITPMYHWAGGDPGKRAYFSVFGAYTDPIKLAKWPGDFIESKGSFISKLGKEYFTAQNWQRQEFTTLDELLGMDDKGQYTKSQTGHEKGDISPTTGLPYKKDQTEHDEGDDKGGKLGGRLTKSPKGGAHPVESGSIEKGMMDSQLPSFVLSQARGMMPTALQNVLQIIMGENDVTTGLLNAAGTGVVTSKEPKKDE